jgi:hypothetical protein
MPALIPGLPFFPIWPTRSLLAPAWHSPQPLHPGIAFFIEVQIDITACFLAGKP